MRKLKKLFFFILLLLILIFGGVYQFQEKFIFLPDKLPQDYAFQFDHEFEEIFVEPEDGARLNAIHFKQEKPRGIILYFHGNAGDLSRWGQITTYFLKHNYEVLVMDYRTYGKSTGTLSEDVLYADAELFYQKAKEFFPERQIIVYGRSLGSCLASYVASRHNPRKLILEAPFYDFTKLVREKVPYLPVSMMLKYEFPTARFLNTIKCPVTIIHGTEDGVVPYESGQQLFSILPPELRFFVKVEGGKHNDLINYQAYRLAIYKELL